MQEKIEEGLNPKGLNPIGLISETAIENDEIEELNQETERELTEEEKVEIERAEFLKAVKEYNESRGRFKKIIHHGNITINKFGKAERKKRQQKRKVANKSRKANR